MSYLVFGVVSAVFLMALGTRAAATLPIDNRDDRLFAFVLFNFAALILSCIWPVGVPVSITAYACAKWFLWKTGKNTGG